MSEPKDPAIKLFGMTIPVLELPPGAPPPPLLLPIASVHNNNTISNREPDSTSSNSLPDCNTESDGEDQEADKDAFGAKQEVAGLAVAKELANPDTSPSVGENPKTPSVDLDSSPSRTSKPEEQNETINSQEKTLKKPDKILPCPRCNSMETKFCYFNNYNVNQPRHFCKNCQRYWTAGGTMRNVPVGAGRRKNKNSSHHRQIAVPEPFQNARAEVPNGVHHPLSKPNGTVLAFGSDKPLCESMNSVLNLTDKTRNGQKPEELRIPSSYGSGESDNHSNGSSATASSLKEEAEKSEPRGQVLQNCQGFYPTQIPCFPGAPLPYPWNPAQWSSPVSPPTFLPPSFPIPFYPATPYWGCALPGNWNIPWLPQPSSPKPATLSSGPNSPTLGKHSREDHMTKPSNSAEGGQKIENNGERCLWIPKTLRIDDPGEAAKSSIWATLGIKNEKSDSVDGGLFKAFKSKGDEKNPISQPSPVLQVNPAALSRSVKFHENS